MKATLWKRETSDTRPRGLGYLPTYHFDEPHHSDAEMIWVTPIEVELPEGYEVAECQDGSMQLYNKNGEHVEVLDCGNKPAILIKHEQTYLYQTLKQIKK